MKKLFLTTLIVALIASALVAIGMLLFGSVDTLMGQIIATTSSIGLFSLSAFCQSLLLEREPKHTVPKVGILITGITLLVSFYMIWSPSALNDPVNPTGFYVSPWKIFGTLLILTGSFTHANLMLLAKQNNLWVTLAKRFSIGFAILAGIFFLLLIWTNIGAPEWFGRLLGIFLVLATLATVLTPILNKVINKNGNGR